MSIGAVDAVVRHNDRIMPPSLSDRRPAERSCWFDSDSARSLLGAEQREVIPLLTAHIGVRGLYLRPGAALPGSLSGNMLQSVISLYRDADRGWRGDLHCDEHALPIENDSMCLVYALHSLDDCGDPAALLDELRRVLRPDGVMFLLGLSPASAWRLRWSAGGVSALGAHRAKALLAAAGLTVEAQLGLGPLWPSVARAERRSGAERSHASVIDPLRPGYLLLARKRRASLTPIGLRGRAAVALRPQVRPG